MSSDVPLYDAAVIGGGLAGCAVLRALTLGGLRCVLLERGADLLSGASKGNSAILHTGFDAPPGSLELRLMQAGRADYLAIRERMNLPLLETDAVLAAWSEQELQRLPDIADQAHRNGVDGVRPLARDEIFAKAPHLGPDVAGALLVPGEHLIDPWSAPHAYALQAVLNGAAILRRAEVRGARREAGGWTLDTAAGPVRAGLVVNCAGNFGDRVEALHRDSPFTIKPRKGQFVVFDKTARRFLSTIVLPVPNERTKGVVVTPTIFGNVLVGPTAEEQEEREIGTVDRAALEALIGAAGRIVPALRDEPVTATYAGIRPATPFKDFVIEALPAERWIVAGGIRSTGLTAALGIGQHVAALVAEHFVGLKPLNDPAWPRMPNLAEHLPRDHQRPGRGDLVCLCEYVTADEIEAALAGPLPAGDLGGLKRRTRAMMGRCQGFNCQARVCAMAEGRLLEAPEMPHAA